MTVSGCEGCHIDQANSLHGIAFADIGAVPQLSVDIKTPRPDSLIAFERDSNITACV
jgi:hypothetical protein